MSLFPSHGHDVSGFMQWRLSYTILPQAAKTSSFGYDHTCRSGISEVILNVYVINGF